MGKQFDVLKNMEIDGHIYHYYSLPELEKYGYRISRLPVSLRIILESIIRNMGNGVTEDDVLKLINWKGNEKSNDEISFIVSRVIMQDLTGVPAVVDLSSMRDLAAKLGKDPKIIEPHIPVDLVIDHSVQVDNFGSIHALDKNMNIEFSRNKERYKFLKWANNTFEKVRIIPPGNGIIHQVNLEHLASVVLKMKKGDKTILYPDSLVGTDSHTTMINGMGIVGWGVGGIEAEAAMLNQPVTFLMPEVVGVKLSGKLGEGITSTDLVLTLTQILRKSNVVGKFVEFFGDGIDTLSLEDRATVSNMCPEYGATIALFPVDEETIRYLTLTGRSEEQVKLVEKYYKAQQLFGRQDSVEYSQIIEMDLSTVKPSVSGPKLPQQRLSLDEVKQSFISIIPDEKKATIIKESNGNDDEKVYNGDVVIAAITSCTNTSNPRVLIAAGLLAKNAVEMGLKVSKKVKTSLAPGSRVVTEYLSSSGLLQYLEKLGFYVVGYGCTTCIGNSGPLNKEIEKSIVENDLRVAAVLSGNRNFEARIHKNVAANYLASPPLVVAYAIAGNIMVDLTREPLGNGNNGKKIFLKDVWPSKKEIDDIIAKSVRKEIFIEKYGNLENNPDWKALSSEKSINYKWDEDSTYIKNPPFFEQFKIDELPKCGDIENGYPLLVLGDVITTDHISPAGSIGKDTPAGRYLQDHGVKVEDFNTYGSRRGNHELMMRGTFANSKLKNSISAKIGGYTTHYPDRVEMSVFDAAMLYKNEHKPLVVFAGSEYGSGSSRDWAAKGPYLLGVKAVIAKSFERIHRSNLIGMGILPLQFKPGEDFNALRIDEGIPITVTLPKKFTVGSEAILRYMEKGTGEKKQTVLKIRIDTPVEADYYMNGGILHYVLRNILRT